jgi:lipoprotein-anchoring transpeptidase ErfK/SrfK
MKNSQSEQGVFRPFIAIQTILLGMDLCNLLVKRWLELNANGMYSDTYGIHSNNNESSIGKYANQSCVGMHNTEVEKLHGKVQMAIPVAISHRLLA